MIKFPADQGLLQLSELALALVLSALLGLERELRSKSAGLRTNTLVGVGAALFMLVSKYGFDDVVQPWQVTLDPSRVAAQVASGIGFIGGGLIFVRRDVVSGLTTAAVVWVSAAVGLACGAGLPVLATAVTVGHLIVVYGFTALNRRLPDSRHITSQLRLTYTDGTGALRNTLRVCTKSGFSILAARVERTFSHDCPDNGTATLETPTRNSANRTEPLRAVSVVLEIQGKRPAVELVTFINEIAGVISVGIGDADDFDPPKRQRVRTYGG